MLKSIFSNRITSRTSCYKLKTNYFNLTKLEEILFLRYILDIDKRVFALRLAGIENITNYILESRGG
jgi:hypothetical protein